MSGEKVPGEAIVLGRPHPAQDAAAALRCPASRMALTATTTGLDSSFLGTLLFKAFTMSWQFPFSDASQIHPFPSVSTTTDAGLDHHLPHAISFAPPYHATVSPAPSTCLTQSRLSVNTHCSAQNPTEQLVLHTHPSSTFLFFLPEFW